MNKQRLGSLKLLRLFSLLTIGRSKPDINEILTKIRQRIAILLRTNLEDTILDKIARTGKNFFPNYSLLKKSWRGILGDLNSFRFWEEET
jgi:hypothetical protein